MLTYFSRSARVRGTRARSASGWLALRRVIFWGGVGPRLPFPAAGRLCLGLGAPVGPVPGFGVGVVLFLGFGGASGVG